MRFTDKVRKLPLRTPAETLIRQTLNMVLPARCAVTGDLVPIPGTLSPVAFSSLDFIAAPFCACCGMAFGHETPGDTICAPCLTDRPGYHCARAVLKYNDASRAMILSFKHGDKMHLVKTFAPWMARAGQEMLARADMLVPVPLHRSRLRARRYNQSMVLAAELGKISNMRAVPDLLIRHRATPVQGHLPPQERRKNVAGAFLLNKKYINDVRSTNIILIDDVYTTGATVGECVRILRKNDAANIDVLTLARV